MLARQRAIFPDTAENALKEEFFGARTGYFVDVGANDPKDIIAARALAEIYVTHYVAQTKDLVSPTQMATDVLDALLKASPTAAASGCVSI